MAVPQLPEWATALGAEPSRYQAFLRRRQQGGGRPAGYGNDMTARRIGSPAAQPQGPNPNERARAAANPNARFMRPDGQQPRRMSNDEMQRGLDAGTLPLQRAVAQLDARRAAPMPMPPAAAPQPPVTDMRANPMPAPTPMVPPGIQPLMPEPDMPAAAAPPSANPMLVGNPDIFAELLRRRFANVGA